MRERKNDKRDLNLDLAKLMACVAVVGLHSVRLFSTMLTEALYLACGFAVPVFLVCSGYTLLRRDSVKPRYVVGKLGRVLRIVICWHVAAFAVGAIQTLLHGGGFPLDQLFALPQTILDSLKQRTDFWHFWYLGMLLVLYALLPELVWLAHSGERVRYKLGVWALSAAVCFVIQLKSEHVTHYPVQGQVVQTFRLWSWIQYLLMGHLLWALEDRWRRRGPRGSLLLHTIALMAATVGAVYFQYYGGQHLVFNTFAEYFYDSPIIMLWVALLFTWVMRLPLNGFARSVVAWFAPLTMGIYLIHPLLLNKVLTVWYPGSGFLSIAFFAALFLGAMLIAFVISKIPILKKLIEL